MVRREGPLSLDPGPAGEERVKSLHPAGLASILAGMARMDEVLAVRGVGDSLIEWSMHWLNGGAA